MTDGEITAAVTALIAAGVSPSTITSKAQAVSNAVVTSAVLAAIPPVPAGFDSSLVSALKLAVVGIQGLPASSPGTAAQAFVDALSTGDPTAIWQTAMVAVTALLQATGVKLT